MTQRRKKGLTGGENGETNTLDIPHEEVQPGPQNLSPSVAPTIETVDDQISHEIAKFNFPDAAIAKLKETYGGLTIKGQDDKAGYEAVRKAWSDVRSKRTGLEKKGLELRNNFTVITKAIKTEETRLIDLLSPLEIELHDKWKAIDNEKERQKKEQEEAEGKRLMARIEELQEIGMKFKDGFYQIGDTISVDVATLRAMTDDTYAKMKSAATKKADEIAKALAESKRIADEAAAEFQRQQDELKKQQELLKKQQEEMQRQQNELKKQQEEAARMKLELRASKFMNWGFEKKGQDLVYDNGFENVRVELAEYATEPDDTFDALLAQKIEEVKNADQRKITHDQQVEAEKQEKARKEKYIADALETAGMKYVWADRLFRYMDDEVTLVRTWAEMLPLSDEAISAQAQELSQQITAAKKAQEQREQKKHQEEEKAQKLTLNDKQRWEREIEQMSAQVLRIVPAEYKTAKYQKQAQNFLDRLTNLVNEFK